MVLERFPHQHPGPEAARPVWKTLHCKPPVEQLKTPTSTGKLSSGFTAALHKKCCLPVCAFGGESQTTSPDVIPCAGCSLTQSATVPKDENVHGTPAPDGPSTFHDESGANMSMLSLLLMIWFACCSMCVHRLFARCVHEMLVLRQELFVVHITSYTTSQY